MAEAEHRLELWRYDGEGGLRIEVTFPASPSGLQVALEELDDAYNEAKFQLLLHFQEVA